MSETEPVYVDPAPEPPPVAPPKVGETYWYGNAPGWYWLVTQSEHNVLYLELFNAEGHHAGAAEPMTWPEDRWMAFLTKFNASPRET